MPGHRLWASRCWRSCCVPVLETISLVAEAVLVHSAARAVISAVPGWIERVGLMLGLLLLPCSFVSLLGPPPLRVSGPRHGYPPGAAALGAGHWRCRVQWA